MSSLNVKVHPVVLFNILDLFERRPMMQNRVIGTLLGQNDKNGNIEVTNCFVVQHREANKEVAVDIEVAKELYELHRKVNPNEQIIGWFSSGKDEYSVTEYSVVIHDYYARETNNPIHLTVDPTKNGISIKGYTSTPFGVPNKDSAGTMFSPIKNVSIVGGYESELVGLKACMIASQVPEKPYQTSFDSEIEMIITACKKSNDLINTIVKFIDDVVLADSSEAKAKQLPANSNQIGRQLMSMVESVIPFSEDDKMLNNNLKDLLMVIYLSNLTKTQLMLNEKLTLW